MAARVDVPAVRRFVDGVAIAVQRGTPLADVLRAQAGDARADLHRALLEIAGRKELLMLVPVVFLVLPTVVLVALYPAISSLAVPRLLCPGDASRARSSSTATEDHCSPRIRLRMPHLVSPRRAGAW